MASLVPTPADASRKDDLAAADQLARSGQSAEAAARARTETSTVPPPASGASLAFTSAVSRAEISETFPGSAA